MTPCPCLLYSISKIFHNCIYFLVARGLCCCARALSSCGEWRPLSDCSMQASLVAERGLWGARVSAAARGLGSCATQAYLLSSKAWGIFLDRGLSQCPLHCKLDSSPLGHHRSPWHLLFSLVQTVSCLPPPPLKSQLKGAGPCSPLSSQGSRRAGYRVGTQERPEVCQR